MYFALRSIAHCIPQLLALAETFGVKKDRNLKDRTALVTGASTRIGAEIVRRLHGAGARVGIHYRHLKR